MLNLECPSCGPQAFLLLNGYEFGDRPLEGVLFEIREENGNVVAAYKDEADALALFKTNAEREHWRRAAEDYAKETDLLACPTCYDDIEQLVDDEEELDLSDEDDDEEGDT